jgi:seryl-tRNA synthetase
MEEYDHGGGFQQADGSIVIPEVLRKYMGIDKIQ